MKILVEISASGDDCITGNNQCVFFATAHSYYVCRAFKEQSLGKKSSERNVRLFRNDYGDFQRCQQCKDAE